MPGAGFKTGLFGFNREDVLRYIEQQQKTNSQAAEFLKNEIEQLKAEIEQQKAQNEQLSAEFETSKDRLKYFEEKQDEIERLSQGIGTLYLVAKTNAEEIMKHALNSSHTAVAETHKNIQAIENTQNKLLNLKSQVENTSTAFSKEVTDLLDSLKATREKIEQDTRSLKVSEEKLSSLVKETSYM